ncbi:MAG: Gfo/Idh/MocA family oxidoreductase [Bacteroidetes bacterium]|nr:Gfo/Idh/MocA family oxidoreductase [Bacteroidota bacterium]
MQRRFFLQSSISGLALGALDATALMREMAPKEYKVALIGCGWYGKSDLFRLIQVAPVRVVGLCDVDKNHLEEARALIKERSPLSKPRLFDDHQKMLKETQPEIVLIGTPDHWHALTCIDSIKAGAHVYVQKPISVDVIEGEAMVAAARKYNRTVQVGLQRRSTPHLLDAKRNILDAGLLGKIRHVEMCCYYHMRNSSRPDPKPIPEFLNYDRWTGPAPLRVYDNDPHRGWWRAFREYGNGIMGDMCVHMFDSVRWLLQLGWPQKISSTGGIFMDKDAASNIADTQTAVFEYPELNCVWQHRTWGTPVNPDYPWAFTIYGEKGTLWASTTRYDFYPEGKGDVIHGDVLYEREKYPEDVTERMIELHCAPATRGQMVDFLQAIEEKRKPVADIHEAHISTASCILANLSMDLGRPLVYDPATMTVKGDVQATALLKRSYRNGYTHPEPGII